MRTAVLVVVSSCFVFTACTPARIPGATAPGSSSGGESEAAGAAGVEFGSLPAAIAGRHRTPSNRGRDAALHPRETLEFFGIRPNQRLVELNPGEGWFTELLAPLLHEDGALIAVVPEGPSLTAYLGLLQSNPAVYDKVELVTLTPSQPATFGAEASTDLVFSFDDFHDWLQADQVEAVLAEIARVLKPNGVYGVVEARAKPGATREMSLASGYIPEALVIEAATKVGLVLEARSQVNSNPRDTKDHPDGVSTLPPTLSLGARDRARYQAIGEPDRMTLRFRKPSLE